MVSPGFAGAVGRLCLAVIVKGATDQVFRRVILHAVFVPDNQVLGSGR